MLPPHSFTFFFFNDTATTEIYTLSLHDALPISAANIVPLVLIPQIIMGAALIKYEDMNRNLGLLYSLSHWISEHPSTDKTLKTESKLQVPLVCQFIAMRWSYEEMVVAQAKLNPLTRRQDRTNDEIQKLAPKANTAAQRERLND